MCSQRPRAIPAYAPVTDICQGLLLRGNGEQYRLVDFCVGSLWLKPRKLEMNAGHFEQLSDCWSSEQQPATYYRAAAVRARRLQADATTPRVKQYLDKMIAHCERLAGKVEPGVPARSVTMRRPKGICHWAQVVEIDEQQFLRS